MTRPAQRPVPPRLVAALRRIVSQSGESIGYIFFEMNQSTASSYVSQLRWLGLATIYRSECWPTSKGSALIASKP